MLPADIIDQVPTRYEKALASGDLFFFPSTVHKHQEFGIEVEIRLCPALQMKPALPTPHFDPAADASLAVPSSDPFQKHEPFSPPYIPNLLVGEIRDEEEDTEYVILLNKYSVVPLHFLLVTKEFESQTAPLTPPDLVQSYQILSAARNAGRTFFAFYNCGDNSGASQPHKHVQFIQVDGNGPPIEHLARSMHLDSLDKPFSITPLPYANHVVRFPYNMHAATPEQLEETLCRSFLALLDQVIASVRRDPAYPSGSPSYNVVLTLEHLHLIPRKYETHTLELTREKLSINALGFAGMLLVKSDEELDAVRTEGIGKILAAVGLDLDSLNEPLVDGTSVGVDS